MGNDYKKELRDILNIYPKHYSNFVKKDKDICHFLEGKYPHLSIKEQIYCYLNDETNLCKYNNPKKFKSITFGYSGCCITNSNCKCRLENQKEKVKQTNLDRYGGHPLQNKDIKEKIKQSNLEKYGVEHHFSNKLIRDKIKQTNLDRYGGHPSQNNDIKEKAKQSNLEKYGVAHHMQLDSQKAKIKQTNLNRYGVEYALHYEDIKQKTKQTMLERYGVEHALQNKDIKEKVKQTNLDRYGGHPLQNKDIKIKSKQTNLDRYGVAHHMQLDRQKAKIKQTNLDKYGVPHAIQNEVIKAKIKQTNLDKYGVENVFANKEIKEKIKQTNLKRYNSLHYNTGDVHREMMYNNLSIRINNACTPLFSLDEYSGVEYKNKYRWQCNTCDTEFMDHIDNGRIPRCPTCYPHNQSKWELEIQEYIKEYIDIETNTKQIINPYELDIYIPNKRMAIECNGTYWHSESQGKDETYHLNKTQLCEEQNIQLLHIWEHEYNNKPDLVKSLIKSNLGLNEKIDAKKTNVKLVDNKTKDLFLEENYIQGACNSTHNIGLYYENELVALMSFDNTKDNEHYEWELINYCSKQNISIVGGANKLFKYFVRNYNPINIISYTDRRYSSGNIYKQLGFEFVENSLPNFKYTKDYKITYNRIQFQKHKLSEKLDVFDENLTESQNIHNNGYDKLWDCGDSAWGWENAK